MAFFIEGQVIVQLNDFIAEADFSNLAAVY